MSQELHADFDVFLRPNGPSIIASKASHLVPEYFGFHRSHAQYATLDSGANGVRKTLPMTPPTSELTARIRRVTEDLQAIQQELGKAAEPGGEATARNQIMEEMLNMELIEQFKSSVDQMRVLLFSYIEAAASEGRQTMYDTLQSIRMRRVTEMLKILQPTVENRRNTSSTDLRSLMEIVNQIAKPKEDAAKK
jgi:hypothetical protein